MYEATWNKPQTYIPDILTKKLQFMATISTCQLDKKNKYKWFVYCCEDMACDLVYIGSTTDVCKRWASTKKACIDGNSSNTGLYKHFMNGCPGDSGDGKLQHLRWTLIDFMETSQEKLTTAGHVGGPKCRCSECQRLKSIEDKWICRMGSFYGSGLNTRDVTKQDPE